MPAFTAAALTVRKSVSFSPDSFVILIGLFDRWLGHSEEPEPMRGSHENGCSLAAIIYPYITYLHCNTGTRCIRLLSARRRWLLEMRP